MRGLVLLLVLSASVAQADWTEKISMKGDFRFRNETITEDQAAGEDLKTVRQRLRLRLGVNAKINDETDVITRLATGTSSLSGSTSTNQTMDEYYTKKSILLDLAYFEWRPSENLKIWGGKTAIPFYTVGGSDLYFDTDITPEGMAVKYKGGAEKFEYMVNLGSSWLDERTSASTTDSDVGLLGAQLAGRYTADNFNVLLGVSHFAYANVKGKLAGDAAGSGAKGNSVTAFTYDNDYEVLAYMIEFGTKISDVPVMLFAEVIENTEVKTEEMGSIYGLKVGSLKEKKDISFTLDYRELEKDATLGVLSESDVSGGGTDLNGLRAGLYYQGGENFVAGLTHMVGELGVSGTARDYTRTMLDFGFGF